MPAVRPVADDIGSFSSLLADGLAHLLDVHRRLDGRRLLCPSDRRPLRPQDGHVRAPLLGLSLTSRPDRLTSFPLPPFHPRPRTDTLSPQVSRRPRHHPRCRHHFVRPPDRPARRRPLHPRLGHRHHDVRRAGLLRRVRPAPVAGQDGWHLQLWVVWRRDPCRGRHVWHQLYLGQPCLAAAAHPPGGPLGSRHLPRLAPAREPPLAHHARSQRGGQGLPDQVCVPGR